MLQYIIRVLGAVVLFLIIGGAPVWAQNAQFSGIVTDPQGAVVPNATVQVLNLDTAVKITTKTDASGAYLVPFLPAGRYHILVQAAGFDSGTSEDLDLRVGQAFVFNVRLIIGSAKTEVTVEGNSVTQVHTDNAEVTGTVTGAEVTGLQLNGRNFTQLISLVAGVSNQTGQDEAKVGVLGSVSYSVNGGRVEYNSFQVDGSETLNTGMNKQTNTLIIYPSVDAIQEIKVLTSNYGAQYPSTGNATTLVTTKSGTDSLHGNLFEFVRNEDWNAKGFFDIGTKAPEYRRNDFGGTIGGPVYIPHVYDGRNKTHFFFSEEVRLEKNPTPYRQGVPSMAERSGDFSDVCPYAAPGQITQFDPGQYPDCPSNPSYGSYGVTFPGNNIAQFTTNFYGGAPSVIANAILATGIIPAPNATSGCNSSIGSCYLQEVSLPTYYREELFRVDQSIGSKTQASFRYIHDAWNTTTPVPQYALIQNSFPTVQNYFTGPGLSLVGRVASAFTPRLLNEFVFSYTGSHITLTDVPGPGVTLQRPAALDNPPNVCTFESCTTPPIGYLFNNGFGDKMPGIVIGGTNAAYGGAGFSVDSSYMPWNHKNPVYSLSDNVTKIIAKHTFTFGAQWVLWNRMQTNGPIGAATGDVQGIAGFNALAAQKSTGNAFADFLLYVPPIEAGPYQSFTPISYFEQDSSQGQYHQRYQIVEPYFQDDWKATSRLTVNLGLRMSLFGTFREVNGKAYNWVPSAYHQAATVDPDFGLLLDANGGLVPTYLQNGQLNPLLIPGIVQCGANGVPQGCMTGHLWNPAPRVGFAWDLLGNGKTSLRAGYGVFFEHGTGFEANTGSLEASAPLVVSMIQPTPPNWNCIGFPSGAGTPNAPYASGCFQGFVKNVNYPNLIPGAAFPINVTSIPTKAIWPYVQQWSLSVEQQFLKNYLFTAGYVGSKGTHLTLERELNQLLPVSSADNPFQPHQPLFQSDCVRPAYDGASFALSNGVTVDTTSPAYTNLLVACGIAAPNSLREFAPGLGQIYSLENAANSSYNALQLTLRRTAGPLVLSVAYTYSHSIDDSSDRSDATFVNSYDVRANRASSNFDQRQLLHMSYIYDLPLEKWIKSLNSWADSDPTNEIASHGGESRLGDLAWKGWQWSGLTIFETGIPFTVINNGGGGVSILDNAGVANGVGSGSYPDLCGNPYGPLPAGGNNSRSFGPLLLNPGAFCAPTGLTFGDAGRNSLRNPSRLNFDMALVKNFPLPKEFGNLQFRAEAFNIFNHTQFNIYDPTLGNQPNNTISCYEGVAPYSGAGGNGTDCLTGFSFLHPVSAHRPRTLQLGLKLSF